jgi:hypothetical protein
LILQINVIKDIIFSFKQSTKGHSALRKWSYAPTSRASVYAEDIYYPEAYIRPRGYYGMLYLTIART